MALTGDELTDEVQALTGRTGDAVLIDDTRVTRWLNEAQRTIVEKCPGLQCNLFKNTTSVDTSVQLSYDLAEFTVGNDDTVSNHICHILGVSYLDGLESRPLTFIHVDEFDEEYPDPTHSDIPKTKPTHWTRRGDAIELFPLCLTAYCDDDIRVDGNYYPREFTTSDSSVSDLEDADDGLIYYATAKAWKAIGQTAKYIEWKEGFSNWLADYKEQNDLLPQWDGEMFGDALD